MSDLKQAIQREYLKCASDPVHFMRKYCTIQHPTKGKVKFDLYPFQEKCLTEFKENRYNIILKARQLGISTLSAGYSLWLMLFHNDKNVLVIATGKDTAKNLVTKVRVMYEGLPQWLKTGTEEINKLSLRFKNGSQIKAIASNESAGRSEALSLLIIDEAAFIDRIDTIWTAAQQTLATGGGCIALSTPNGVGNWFHKQWMGAEEGTNQFNTPLSLGQEFSGYHAQLTKCIERIKNSLDEIYFLAQGGTAVGTGINTKKGFDKKIVAEIKKITKLPFKPSTNKFASLASHDAIVNFSGTMNTAAVCLMKIANDIRFLGSGPRAGYGELILPENEPGSSIMPGKVNPTQCEAVTMVCVKVIGNHNGITMAGSHGHFELNVFKPLIIHNILQSIHIMADSSKSFAKYCVAGLKADKKRIQELLDNSLMLVTALAPKIGYDNAAKIAKAALKNKTTLKAEALKSGLINENDYNKIVDPRKMIYPA